MWFPRKRTAGFSLIETVISLAVAATLVVLLSAVAGRAIQSSKESATQQDVQAMFQAIVGDPSRASFGFLGDMGRLPATLAELVTQGAQIGYHFSDPPPSGATQHIGNAGIGWRGPYLTGPFATADLLNDRWGQALTYTASGASAGQILSGGPDGVAGNTDDIAFPVQLPVQTTGTIIVTVIVNTIPQPTGLSVSVYSVSNGEQAAAITQTTAANGKVPFRFTVPHGVSMVVATHTSGSIVVTRTVSMAVTAGTQVATTIIMSTTGTVDM